MSLFDQIHEDDTPTPTTNEIAVDTKRGAVGQIVVGDCAEILSRFDDERFQTCVTSPPYWGLRDYGIKGQIGLEEDPSAFVDQLVSVFREVRRVLRDDGT